MARKTTRRDFFMSMAAEPGPEPESPLAGPSPASAAETYLLHVSRRAMACQFEAVFNAGQYPDASTAGLKALDVIDEMEELLSYFRATSQITRLNVLAGEGPVEVDPRLFDLLKLALDVGRQTDWALDVTSAPLWEAWGFSRRAGKLPSEDQVAEARSKVGGQMVELDDRAKTVRFQRAGMLLNLGSIGKGYALDRAAEVLLAEGIGDFLFHGGQSSILARGTRMHSRQSADPQEAGWSVGVPHPLHPERRLAEIRLLDRALGTSAGTFQYFRHRGKRYGHLLDPRTGWPAEGTLSVTVLAPTAALADGLSTAFYVLGPQRTGEFCRSRPDIAALTVVPAKGRSGIEALTVGFQADELQLLAPTDP